MRELAGTYRFFLRLPPGAPFFFADFLAIVGFVIGIVLNMLLLLLEAVKVFIYHFSSAVGGEMTILKRVQIASASP